MAVQYKRNYQMGSTRGNGLARIADNPYKPDHLRPYTERKSVKGVPAKWRPVYDELCRRMFERMPDALDFSWEGSTLITRPFDYLGPRDQGWTEHATPEAAAGALGIRHLLHAAQKTTRPKATPTPKAPKVEPKPVSELPPPPAAPTSNGWPAWADEYLNRLVYKPKRDYAVKWLEHVLEGTSAPADPGHEWAHKVRARVAKLAKTA